MENLRKMNIRRERMEKIGKAEKAFWSVAGVASATVLSVTPAFAADSLADKLRGGINKVYGLIFGISTVLAVCLAAVCFILRMTSKNQKTVDEATQWLKRIIICWACIMLLATFVTFFQDITGGGLSDLNKLTTVKAT